MPRGLTAVNRAVDPAQASRRTAWLVYLGAFWVLAGGAAALGAVVFTDWPPIPELPTIEQVRNARTIALAVGAFAVLPPVLGVFLAHRWRNDVALALFLVGTMGAVLVMSVVLVGLTTSAVR